jgi:DNA-binding response OmpR family regulator
MAAGVDDHLRKPLDTEQLQAKLIAGARISGLHRQLG